jgi:hypothetical protein
MTSGRLLTKSEERSNFWKQSKTMRPGSRRTGVHLLKLLSPQHIFDTDTVGAVH